MSQDAATVADIFRRAQSLRRASANFSRKDLTAQLTREYAGKAFPPVEKLAIPEQDARAPEEDWSAGLSITLRGIQTENWAEVIDGVLMCLDQTERYESEREPPVDTWHDRSIGIKEQTAKGVEKWMPDDLMHMAEKASKQ
ncbi:MAG: hypothetical protein NVSMB56_17610 [Pyrinomonadaceae bacterium]